MTKTPIDIEEIGRYATTLLNEQRARIVGAPGWNERLTALRAREEPIVRASLGVAPTYRLLLPSSWTAPEAIAALGSVLGVGKPPLQQRSAAPRSPT
jgi:hypothetical protein